MANKVKKIYSIQTVTVAREYGNEWNYDSMNRREN